jgi:hypothetical protein
MPGRESRRKAMRREFEREVRLKARAIKRELRRAKSLNPGKGEVSEGEIVPHKRF